MRLLLDLARNTIELRVAEPPVDATRLDCPATVDVGESGRLLGVELALPNGESRYVAAETGRGELARSAGATAGVVLAADGSVAAITLPRRGPGYELSYPSGNRCWLPDRDGRFSCALAPPGR